MKKPRLIGISSIFPSLGFMLLGEVRQGIIGFAIVAFLVLVGALIQYVPFQFLLLLGAEL